MSVDITHFPWYIQKLKDLFAANGLSLNKNKLPILALIFIASITLGIFIVNIFGLVTSSPSVKTAIAAEKQEPSRTEQTGPELLRTSPQTALIEAAPIHVLPSISVEKKTADPAPNVENISRFTIDSYLYRARQFGMNKDYSNALTSYKKALERDSSNFIVMNNISYIYLQLDLIKESIEYSLRAIKINRDYVPALSNVGIAYARSGYLSDAEDHFTRALELEPANQEVRLNLALLHEKQGRFPEAAENHLRLVKAGNIDGALGLARIYEKEDRIIEAMKFYMNIYNNDSIDLKTKTYVRKRFIILQNKKRNITK